MKSRPWQLVSSTIANIAAGPNDRLNGKTTDKYQHACCLGPLVTTNSNCQLLFIKFKINVALIARSYQNLMVQYRDDGVLHQDETWTPALQHNHMRSHGMITWWMLLCSIMLLVLGDLACY